MKLALVFTLLAVLSLALLSNAVPLLPVVDGGDTLFQKSLKSIDIQPNVPSAVAVQNVQLQTDFVLANSDPAQYTFSDVHTSCSNIAQIDSPGAWFVTLKYDFSASLHLLAGARPAAPQAS